MAGGRERGGTHRRGWFHRGRHHRSVAHPAETADVVRPGPGDAADADGDGDEGLDRTPDEPGPPASLDQVLRRAAEARDAGHDPDD